MKKMCSKLSSIKKDIGSMLKKTPASVLIVAAVVVVAMCSAAAVIGTEKIADNRRNKKLKEMEPYDLYYM